MPELPDFSQSLTRISRAWNAAKTNGAIALLLRETRDLCDGRWRADAAGLPSGSIYNSTNVTRDLGANARAIEYQLKLFGGAMVAALPVPSTQKQSAFKVFQRAWVDASVIYAERVSVFGSMVSDVVSAVTEYGQKLADAGVAAPAVVVADIARVASKNVKRVAEGAADVVRDIGQGAGALASGAGDAIASTLFGGWKVLLIAGVVVFVLRKPILAAVGLRGLV